MLVVSASFSAGPEIMVSRRSVPVMRLAASTKGRAEGQPRCWRPMPTLREPW